MEREQFNKIRAYYTHYRQQLSGLRDRIKQNNLWYKCQQTEFGRNKGKGMEGAPESRTGHLFNAIQYKHADIMDNFPHINILPREEGDEREAEILSGIMPFILDNCDFKKTYSRNSNEKLKSGTALYGVFYQQNEENGGDIVIEGIDLLRFSFQPGIEDIQDSKFVFYDSFMDLDEFKELYGEKENIQTQATYDEEKAGPERDFLSETVVITDCYYKIFKGGKKVLHFVKFSGNEILEYTEGKEEYADGFYKHGRYPFVFDVLYPEPGEAYGRGIIDVGKGVQAYVDKLDEIINRNAILNGMPRQFVNENAGVNEEEFLDITNPIVHVAGSVDDNAVKEIRSGNLPAFISNHRSSKIEELKEILGNRDFTQGGTTGGVTAASAITALQNSGDKLSRDMISESYHAFSKIIWLVIELFREFYDEERTFRILGEDAKYQYVSYSNKGIQERFTAGGLEEFLSPDAAQAIAEEYEIPVSYEKPMFDISLSVEKNNPYQRSQHNSLILSLFNMGLFVPQNLELGIFVISNLNFDGKDKLLQQMKEMQEKQMLAAVQQNEVVPDGSGTPFSTGPEEEMVSFPTGNEGEDMISFSTSESGGEIASAPMV